MLVLTRKVRERLYIGGDICVTVLRLASGQVRLGIEAPREVSVVRAELVDEPREPDVVHQGHPVPESTRPLTIRRSPFAARETDIPRRGRSR